MEAQIALITIITEDIQRMLRFYCEGLGFSIKTNLDKYVELNHEGVRFAICERSVMHEATNHPSFLETKSGQSFELAFPLNTPGEVDIAYDDILMRGAVPVQAPATMPWGQRTAFFADPDGNIHELFADLPKDETK
jgi:lactoylglutathione lyase